MDMEVSALDKYASSLGFFHRGLAGVISIWPLQDHGFSAGADGKLAVQAFEPMEGHPSWRVTMVKENRSFVTSVTKVGVDGR